MKQLATGLSLCLVFLLSCNSGPKETIADTDAEKTMVKFFSDSLLADTFKVKLLGTDPKNMHLDFSIRSAKGKPLYQIKIRAEDLFKNYDATIDLGKKKNQIKFLKEEMGRFFDEENFIEPAITEQETPDQNVPDKAFYNELKASGLNGFIYRLGKENKVYIGWSEKAQIVKPYYACCK